jgi:hypothetical protein
MRRISPRRIALALLPLLGVLGVIMVVAPLSPRIAGNTRCFPFVGPRVSVDSTMSARERALAVAHEGAHAKQCRRDGFVINYVARLSRRGRLAAELEAFCSEARADVGLGTRADHVVARILDELEEGYPWFRGMTRSAFLAALENHCADVVAPARRRASAPLA